MPAEKRLMVHLNLARRGQLMVASVSVVYELVPVMGEASWV